MLPDQADFSYLLDMLNHAEGVHNAIAGLTLQQYITNETLRLSIERRIEIIGEAARRVSRTFQADHPELPWQKIVAQRHILAHEYGEVDDELIWRVATVHIPPLIQELRRLCQQT